MLYLFIDLRLSSIYTKRQLVYTGNDSLINSLEYSSLTNTKHRKETCLSQAPEQIIEFSPQNNNWRKLNWQKKHYSRLSGENMTTPKYTVISRFRADTIRITCLTALVKSVDLVISY